MKRHPMPIQAHFAHSLVLTYAYPHDVLEPLLPPGLALDMHREFGFVAVAMVQTRDLRPSFLPRWLGRDFFLAGYRIFVRHRDQSGRTRRGLRILRSDTDRHIMRLFGNLMTHYNYRLVDAAVSERDGMLEIKVQSPCGDADLHVIADLASRPAPLPIGSLFRDHAEARRFAGPLPYTFDYEPQTHSIVRIKGVRDVWDPQPIRVQVLRNAFLDQPPFNQAQPILANAFYLGDVEYRWERGVREPLALVDSTHSKGSSSCSS
jgi:hypothetical protein